MSNRLVFMKAVVISAGIVLIALLGMNLAAPFAVNGIPAMWSAVLAWMKPPYLYIIVNGIILTIVMSSRFHRSQPDTPPKSVRLEELIPDKTPAHPFSAQQQYVEDIRVVEEMVADKIAASEIEDAVAEFKPPVVSSVLSEREAIVETKADSFFIDSICNNSKDDIISPEPQPESLQLPGREKPLVLVSSRFGHRKPIRNNPEGTNTKALRVARQRKQETLESTWKMITEGSGRGRHVPLTRQRHQKRPDTWESHSHMDETTARIRKEASPSQDELNRRVEAFIKKFNEEMRMQRQESLNQYMEMINRGI